VLAVSAAAAVRPMLSQCRRHQLPLWPQGMLLLDWQLLCVCSRRMFDEGQGGRVRGQVVGEQQAGLAGGAAGGAQPACGRQQAMYGMPPRQGMEASGVASTWM